LFPQAAQVGLLVHALHVCTIESLHDECVPLSHSPHTWPEQLYPSTVDAASARSAAVGNGLHTADGGSPSRASHQPTASRSSFARRPR
jgi:hypothetical protein